MGEGARLRSPRWNVFEISWPKDSSLLLRAIHSPFYWRISKKTILSSGLKNPDKKFTDPRSRDSCENLLIQETKADVKSLLIQEASTGVKSFLF